MVIFRYNIITFSFHELCHLFIFFIPICIFFQFIILVVDSTDRERLSISKEELHKMLESDELCKAAVLVFANKQVT